MNPGAGGPVRLERASSIRRILGSRLSDHGQSGHSPASTTVAKHCLGKNARSGADPPFRSSQSHLDNQRDFRGLRGACFLLLNRFSITAEILLYLTAAGCIQLRLLCNLLDGMVAIEGGFRSRSGEVFNELPDRVSDVV